MNRVLSKLWMWLWFLLPANPILVRVVHGASRRSRHLYLRIGYLGSLLVVVLVLLFPAVTAVDASLGELAKRASSTFSWASMAQLALMCFMAPVFTASAITQERDAQTFNILLSTPLSSAQIVFGSLMSRLYFVLMLLVAGLPIFLMTMVYGGVTASQVLESFALSASTAVLTGSLAIFVAMIGVGTRRTIFSFYLLIVIYLLCFYLVGRWFDRTWIEASLENVDGRRMSWVTPLHPFLALEVALNRVHAPPFARLGEFSSISRYALAYPSAIYVAWTLSLAFLLTTFSVLFVRRGAKTGESTVLTRIAAKLGRRQMGDRSRKPRHVWNNPVAWREAKTRAAAGGLLRLALIVGGFVGPFIVFLYYLSGDVSADAVSRWLSGLIMIQFALALVVAVNAAASAITREKESKSMELLLTTPLTSKYILWGKLRGLVSFAAPLVAGPMVVLLLFGIHGLTSDRKPALVTLESAFEVGTLLVIYTAFACVVGLWRSLNSKTTMAAVMYSIGILVLCCGLASLIGYQMVDSSGGNVGAFLAPFTPFTAVDILVHPRRLFTSDKEFADAFGAVRTSAFIGSTIAAALYAFVVWRFYAGLVRTFDMTLRKQSSA